MNKKETTKFIVQLIASIASAILTALGATSCMGWGHQLEEERYP